MFVELGIHEDFEPDYELKFIFMKRFFLFSALAVCLALAGCNERQEHSLSSVAQMPVSADTVVSVVEVPRKEKLLTADDVTLTKDLLYDTYTLEDTYPYKDTVRSFKWDVIRNCLAESIPPHYAFQLHGAVQLGTCGGLHRQRNILPVRHIGRIPVSKKQETGKKQE